MKKKKSMLCFLFLSCLYFTVIQAQQAFPATGGNAKGSGGSASYTIGPIAYKFLEGVNGTVAQGVQQPYEISAVTAIYNTESISLEINVYPNPIIESVRLIVKSTDYTSLQYRLYNINGILLQDKMIESEENEISMESLSPAVYFLKVSKDNKEVKVFKIVKK